MVGLMMDINSDDDDDDVKSALGCEDDDALSTCEHDGDCGGKGMTDGIARDISHICVSMPPATNRSSTSSTDTSSGECD